MYTNGDKPQINLAKPWWMKQFLLLQGTALKSSHKSDQQALKKTPIKNETMKLTSMAADAQP
eukprot:11381419-Prorocentrum_lima.AAC.1